MSEWQQCAFHISSFSSLGGGLFQRFLRTPAIPTVSGVDSTVQTRGCVWAQPVSHAMPDKVPILYLAKCPLLYRSRGDYLGENLEVEDMFPKIRGSSVER